MTALHRLGVLGGGQLGRMLALAGRDLGVETVCLDPDPECSCGQVADQVVGAYDDRDALQELARRADRVTFEFESVPAAAADLLSGRLPVFPPVAALAASQDRLHEKRLLEGLGLEVAAFAPVDAPGDLPGAIDRVGLPARLKSRRLGYDGRGQAVLQTPGDAAGAWTAAGSVAAILERVVPFERELAVVAVRGRDGEVACYPPVETRHHQGILRLSLAPAPGLSGEGRARAEAVARRVLDALDYVGVMAVECFEVGGRLLVNELAPRVHNSGHWTIEGAATSQFENHLRAGMGWALGSTEARGFAAMLNCIGTAPDPARVLAIPDCHLHWYGKAIRPGRKLGHATLVAPDPARLDDRLRRLAAEVKVPVGVLEGAVRSSGRAGGPG